MQRYFTPNPLSFNPTTVYLLYSHDDTLLYVGMTNDIANRIRGHKRTKPWWGDVARIEQRLHDKREPAIIEEKQLITSLHPLYNRMLTKNIEPPL